MVLMRKLHKWISLLVGLQVLLWLISGLVISLLDPAKVSGEKWRHVSQPVVNPIPAGPVMDPLDLPVNRLKGALDIRLLEHNARAVYRITYADSEILLDAIHASPLFTGQSEALLLAQRDFTGAGAAVTVTAGIAPGRETRNHHGPYWRIDFSDDARTSIYISAASGKILERRNDYWRIHDFFWMLHIMDYNSREDFNNPLVIAVALVSIWLGISGVVLLVTSLRRRGIRYLNV